LWLKVYLFPITLLFFSNNKHITQPYEPKAWSEMSLPHLQFASALSLSLDDVEDVVFESFIHSDFLQLDDKMEIDE